MRLLLCLFDNELEGVPWRISQALSDHGIALLLLSFHAPMHVHVCTDMISSHHNPVSHCVQPRASSTPFPAQHWQRRARNLAPAHHCSHHRCPTACRERSSLSYVHFPREVTLTDSGAISREQEGDGDGGDQNLKI